MKRVRVRVCARVCERGRFPYTLPTGFEQNNLLFVLVHTLRKIQGEAEVATRKLPGSWKVLKCYFKTALKSAIKDN